MRTLKLPALSIIAMFIASTAHADERIYADPSPPSLSREPQAPTKPASKNPDATFHLPPKPLPAGAVTTDWPSLLGPAHNAFSTETKLLTTFPKNGLTMVWEMTKGEG